MSDELRTTYDKIANDFHEDHKNDKWSHIRVQLFATYFNPGDSVLDIGCGTGIKSRILADEGLAVHGTDFSPGMVATAREHYPNVRFDVLDIKDVGSMPDQYDGILAFAVLLHLPKAETPGVVRDLVDRLKPGGKLMVAVKTVGPNGAGEAVVTEDDYGYEYSRFFSFYTSAEMRGFMENAGLSICYDEAFPPTGKAWSVLIGRKG